MTLRVELLEAAQDAEYILFLEALGAGSPGVLAYHYPVYREMLCRTGIGEAVYLAVRQNGRFTGVLPAFRKKTSAGTVYSSLPFFGPNAGVLCAAGEDAEKIHALLLRELLNRASRDEALCCSIYTPFLSEDFGFYDRAIPEAVTVPKFTQYNELGQPVWEHGALGRNLKKAQRSGMVLSTEATPENLKVFYGLYVNECRANGIPVKPEACVNFLAREGVAAGRVRMYFAHLEGRMAGGLMVLRSPQTVSYYIPCADPEAKTHQPGVALIQRAMEDAAGEGARFWNWESSPDRESGVYRFKKKWNAVEGAYRIYLKVFSQERIEALGPGGIAAHFPYFFVYPFDRFRNSPAHAGAFARPQETLEQGG